MVARAGDRYHGRAMSLYPRISTKKDRTGHSIAFPDVCKVPAPPAPFTPVPLPAEHVKKLADARTLVHRKKSDLERTASGGRGAGDSPKLVGIEALQNIEALIQKHERELRNAPRLEFQVAEKIQKKFERELESEVKELEKAGRTDRELKELARQVAQVVGKAARAV